MKIYLFVFIFQVQIFIYPEEALKNIDEHSLQKNEVENISKLYEYAQGIESKIKEVSSSLMSSYKKLENSLIKHIEEKLANFKNDIDTKIASIDSRIEEGKANIQEGFEKIGNLSSEVESIKFNINKFREDFEKMHSEVLKELSSILNEINRMGNYIETLKNNTSEMRKEVHNISSILNILEGFSHKNEEILSKVTNLEFLCKYLLFTVAIIFIGGIITITFLIYLMTRILKLEKNTVKLLDSNSVSLTQSYEKLVNILEEINLPPEPEKKHKWAIFVASEINNIEKNINKMNPETVGLKQLIRSLTKLKDRLSSEGYEIPLLLGTPYDQGMAINVVSFVEDNTLPEGKSIISNVMIPQVNYKGEMIQQAHVEVSISKNKENNVN